MGMTEEIRKVLTAGRKRGAVIGALLFVVAGLGPGMWLGSMTAVLLLSHLTGSAAEPGGSAAAIVAAGAAVGAVTAFVICITAGMFAGAALAPAGGLFSDALRAFRQGRGQRAGSMTVLAHPAMTERTEAEVRAQLSAVEGLRNSLHSIVVVGSAAHGTRGPGSDIDVVLICTDRGYEAVQSALCEREIADALAGRDRTAEFTVLGPADARRLFKLASPFAFALRYGRVLEDDGFLRSLTAASSPAAPGKRYGLTALYEQIVVPYYGSFRELQASARSRGCSSNCCRSRADCPGLASTDMPAKVILRMLYVTLPSRGYMPLTKGDVITFTGRAYGAENAAIVEQAVSRSRTGTSAFSYAEYEAIKRLAGMLFREILGIVGSTAAVRRVLADGARIMQGDFGQVKDRKLRACVLARTGAGHQA
jgi:predicted nucleotidyltransferase